MKTLPNTIRGTAGMILFLTLIHTTGLRAAEEASPETKLREMLRNTMLQLREAQTQVNTLTSDLKRSDREKKSLNKKLEDLTEEKAAEKKAADHKQQQLEAEIAGLHRLVQDHESKNYELYKLSMEILKRYERFGIGDALTAREPFVGITRVKIQNLVQDFFDEINEQKIQHSDLPIEGKTAKSPFGPADPSKPAEGTAPNASKVPEAMKEPKEQAQK